MGVFVTGIGCISAIGKNVRENVENLITENSGISMNTTLNYARHQLFLGDIKLTNKELLELNGIESQIPYSRTTLLGITAVKEAFDGHELIEDVKTGFINGTSVGGIDISEVFYKEFRNEDASNYLNLLQHDCGTVSQFIAKEIGKLEHISTISTACSSAANAIIHGNLLIEKGILDRVIVGGTDALSIFTINGFDSLQILDDSECRPYDASRTGLNLGEGAAYLVLESERSLKRTGKKPIAFFNGGANCNDAFHQTATSPDADGAFLSMNQALEISGLTPSDIDYINVHGTGTGNNDLTESIGLKRVFGEIPPFSSTKSYTGHTLAACGAIEAVYAIEAMRLGFLPPNLRFQNPIEETGLIPLTKVQQDVEINAVLSNSFGFGGNNSTLIFSKSK